MLYRVEIRKKDGSVKYYGLQQGEAGLEATWLGGFKTAYDVFRCVEAEFREDPTANYALPFASPDEKVDTLKKTGFMSVSKPSFDGSINPVLNPGKASVILYCQDSTVKSSKSTDDQVVSILEFDENAFAAAWEIARNTPRTPIWKSLLLNPSTWYTSATLAVVIGTIISMVNPEAFVQALPYLAIAAPVFAGAGVLMLLVSTIYAIICEKNNPDQPNPVINYLRERAEWIRQNPVKSGLILGVGSVILLAAIVLTIGYFTHGFGIFPVDTFEFMQVVFDGITKLFAAGIDYLSALTGVGASIPAASVTSFSLTAAAVAFVTSIFWTFDTTFRLAHTVTDLTMPPRIKTQKSEKMEEQKRNSDMNAGQRVPPPANQTNLLKSVSSALAPTHHTGHQENQRPELPYQQTQTNMGKPRSAVTPGTYSQFPSVPTTNPSSAGASADRAQQPKVGAIKDSIPQQNHVSSASKRHRAPILTPEEQQQSRKQANFALFDSLLEEVSDEPSDDQSPKGLTLNDLARQKNLNEAEVDGQRLMQDVSAQSTITSKVSGDNAAVRRLLGENVPDQDQKKPPEIPKRKNERNEENATKNQKVKLIKEQLPKRQVNNQSAGTPFWSQASNEELERLHVTDDTDTNNFASEWELPEVN